MMRLKKGAKTQVKGQWNDIDCDAEIGEGTVIWSWNRIGKSKIGKRCNITNWVHIGNDCSIGDDCNFQPFAYLTDGVKIGNRVFFAGGIHTTDIKYITIKNPPFKEPVTIGNDAVLGNGCTLLGGITIGDGAVIGMGAVVTKDVPPNEVWFGVPAKYSCTRAEYEEKRQKHETNKLQV